MQHSGSHSNAICNHRFKTRIELRSTPKAASRHCYSAARKKRQTDRSRTRRTDEVAFIAGCRHFTRKNTRFRAPASSPQHSPCNIHAAIPMRSATTDSRHAKNYADRNTPKAASRHSYSAARKKRQTDRSRTRRTDEVAFIAGCSHFTRKNTRFRAPASSPQHSPCNIHAAIPMRSATTDSRHA